MSLQSLPPIHYDWAYIKRIAGRHKRKLIMANVTALLATLCSVPLPLLMPLLVDEILLNQPAMAITHLQGLLPTQWHTPIAYILTILLITLAFRFASIALNVYQGRLFAEISKEIIFRMRSGLLAHLKHISMSEYETLGSGKVINHLVTDLDTVDEFISTAISRFIVSSLMILGTAAVLLWMHWQLALFILFFNPLVVWTTMRLGKRVKALKNEQNAAYGTFQQSLTDNLEAIHQIRSSNREEYYLGQLQDSAAKVKQHSINFTWRTDAASKLSHMVLLFGVDCFRATAMLMVLLSDLSIGQMFAIFGYLWFMMGPLQEVLNIQYAYFSSQAALARLNTLFELQQEPLYPTLENPFATQFNDNLDAKLTPGISIRLNNVSFAYGDGPSVLNRVNLTIQAGDKVALVGASGGGKSTLSNVLIGLYPPTQGMIYFNDAPVNRIGLAVVREHVATVLQQPALFNDSIRANLSMGELHSDSTLWHALSIAQLDDVVANLPEQLDTVVGRFGMRLSGGQRQRLAIARMVLRNPQVVILDEATSALDSATEAALHQRLSQFLAGRTTIIIAHRLSAVKQADHVYVFEDGTISEQGRHEELIHKDGLYAKLYGEPQQITSTQQN